MAYPQKKKKKKKKKNSEHVIFALGTLKGTDKLSRDTTRSKVFVSFLKRVYSIRNKFGPFGSKVFSFRVDRFSEGD